MIILQTQQLVYWGLNNLHINLDEFCFLKSRENGG